MQDKAFRSVMRSWRQSKDDEEIERLWRELERRADAGEDPFESAAYEPCAFAEAVFAGSIEAIYLSARAARAGGMDLALGMNETNCSVYPKLQEPSSLLEKCWLGTMGLVGKTAELMKVLMKLGADPEGLPGRRGGPLAGCVAFGDVEGAALLIAAGADPLRIQGEGRTLLHEAVGRNDDDVSAMWRLLTDAGVDPEARDDKGQTAWEVASEAQAGWMSALREREGLSSALGPVVGRSVRGGI